MKKPIRLDEKIFLIDDLDLNVSGRTGSYILMEEELTIIETCTSHSVPFILEGLKEIGRSPEEVKYIIVTHIHLDHSGGAGLLLTYCPEAKIIVHPKGAKHLADPSKLITGAKAVYKEQFEELFDPILPIPPDRIITKTHEDTLTIGPECTLSFFDTPGHANHHFSIYHPGVNGMFTGDTAGVTYPQLAHLGIDLFLPSTSPNQFDPEKMLQSIELYEQKQLTSLFFGHYGSSNRLEEVYRQIRYWLPIFVKEAERIFAQNALNDNAVELLKESLYSKVTSSLSEVNINSDHEFFKILNLDLSVSSMGLIDYLVKKESDRE
ncbi:MBL fold metallo-hydrolase [Neobacillus sp. PS3-34]|uniref:MBL fold metallo-hydrolase n=1 Tax=Neobacillus sp. PS3-34 TaxID=3070678 RepID=UPI0027E0A0C8|nr:MBL fold metallo-hydrolase [Neobacillus sp. PS3-34]WML49421.1 MBL fold metallo-hydrolase [Neobacillus sp. PS3-34]